MDINVTKKGTSLTVAVSGRMDTVTAPELDDVLKKQLGGITKLIIDMEKLEYISSAGLRVLLSAQKVMNRQGEMKVTHVNELVMEVFEVTGFTEILTVV